MKAVQKVALEDSFDANGVLVHAGSIGVFDAERLNGKEPLADVNDLPPVAVVEMSPLGPTGPNPVAPQQIPPDARQTVAGGYVAPGRELVGEVTKPQDERLAQIFDTADSTAEGDLAEQLAEAQRELAELRSRDAQRRVAQETGQDETANSGQDDNDNLVAGTVADVTADLGSKTDDELEAIRRAEVDREKPRAGVLNAIKAEQEARKGA